MIVGEGRGGWWEFYYGGPTVYVHAARRADGRVIINALHLAAGNGALTADDLRTVPLRSIEAYLNGQSAEQLARQEAERPEVDDATDKWLRSVAPRIELRPLARRSVLRIKVPTGQRRPDSFYASVARAYTTLAARHRRPAAELAEINNVPVTTMHRWIKEARARGLLPPGTPGKAG